MEFPDSEQVIARRCKKVCCFWIATIVIILVGLMAAIVTLQVVYYTKDEPQSALESSWQSTTMEANVTGMDTVTYSNNVTSDTTQTNEGDTVTPLLVETQAHELTPSNLDSFGPIPRSPNSRMIPFARPASIGTSTTKSVPTTSDSSGVESFNPVPSGSLLTPMAMAIRTSTTTKAIPTSDLDPFGVESFDPVPSESLLTPMAMAIRTSTTTKSIPNSGSVGVDSIGPVPSNSRMIPIGPPSDIEKTSTTKAIPTTTQSSIQRVLSSSTTKETTVADDGTATSGVTLIKLKNRQKIQDILVALILTLFGVGVICIICTMLLVKGVYKKERCRFCISCFECGRSHFLSDSAISETSQQLDTVDSSQSSSATDSQNSGEINDRNARLRQTMETSFSFHVRGLPSYSEAIMSPQTISGLPTIPVPPVTAQDGTLYTQVPHLHRSTSSLPSYEEACKASSHPNKPVYYTHSLPSPRIRASTAYIWPELSVHRESERSHRSSNHSMTSPRGSMTSQRGSLTSPRVSMTSQRGSMTSQRGSMTPQRGSEPSLTYSLPQLTMFRAPLKILDISSLSVPNNVHSPSDTTDNTVDGEIVLQLY